MTKPKTPDPEPQPTLRVMRSAGARAFPWFIVQTNGHVLPQLFSSRAAADAYRQTLLAKGKQ